MSLSLHVRATRGEFDLDVAFETDARALALIGASGAGKTSLLQGLAGLIPTDETRLIVGGDIVVDTTIGLSPPTHKRGVGYVFQDGRLFPHMSVGDNVGFAQPYSSAPMTITDALRLVDMQGFEHRRPAGLSGGETRRVAIARALLARPRLLLLDEPFAGLDDARRQALIPYLVRLRDEVGVPMILVSHDERDVSALAQSVVTINRGRRTEPA